MEWIKKENCIELYGYDFVPQKTFQCGQCFRWDTNGIGIADGHIARVVQQGDIVTILCETEYFDSFWVDYFDLHRDYYAIQEKLMRDERMIDAVKFGSGIRILKQNPWEALISFLISQCNHIPRIRSIIHTLCQMFGDEVEYCGVRRYSFPSAERLASCSLEDLAPLRAGYRTKYLLSAAQRVACGELNLEEIEKFETEQARKVLLTFNGVGNKVADCVLLFGMGKHDAFPVDVWMKRALKEFFGDILPDFGNTSGIAQQYLFHYIRNSKKDV